MSGPESAAETVPADTPADQRRRARMVRDQLTDCSDPRVVAAMAAIPRHAFLPAGLRAGAYDDSARAIGAGQTISQPRIVARMLAALRIQPGDSILDVGAGSGYAAALLAQLNGAGRIVAIERQGGLIVAASQRLAHFAPRVELRHADGLAEGDERFAVIHVAAACPELPEQLIRRLLPGGRLIAPISLADGRQRLLLIDATGQTWLDDVLFVPGLHGVVVDPQ